MQRQFFLKRRLRTVGLLAVAAALAAPAVARADMVTQWNLNATTALMITAGQAPQASVPHLAMVHGAVYDAVNAIDGGHEGYLLTSRLAIAVRLEGRGGCDGGVPRAVEHRPRHSRRRSTRSTRRRWHDPGRFGRRRAGSPSARPQRRR